MEHLFLAGYIVEEVEKRLYKVVGYKVIDLYGIITDVSIDEYNEIVRSRGLDNGYYWDGTYIVASDFMGLVDDRLEIYNPFDSVVYVEVPKNVVNNAFNTDGEIVIREISANVYGVDGKIKLQARQIPIATLTDGRTDITVDVYIRDENIIFRPLDIMPNNKRLVPSRMGKEALLDIHKHRIHIKETVRIKFVAYRLNLFDFGVLEECGLFYRINSYFTLNIDALVERQIQTLILPSDCEYLFTPNRGYTYGRLDCLKNLVINPKFKGFLWFNRKNNNFFLEFNGIESIAINGDRTISELVDLLCSLLVHTLSKRIVTNKIMEEIEYDDDLKDKLHSINWRFNSLISRDSLYYKVKELNLVLY